MVMVQVKPPFRNQVDLGEVVLFALPPHAVHHPAALIQTLKDLIVTLYCKVQMEHL